AEQPEPGQGGDEGAQDVLGDAGLQDQPRVPALGQRGEQQRLPAEGFYERRQDPPRFGGIPAPQRVFQPDGRRLPRPPPRAGGSHAGRRARGAEAAAAGPSAPCSAPTASAVSRQAAMAAASSCSLSTRRRSYSTRESYDPDAGATPCSCTASSRASRPR